MTWKFDNKKPIYSQLIEQMKVRIITGVYEPGGKLPSVRDLATEAGVNPNTMQRALAELETSGLVFAQRTAGRFITEDKEMIKDARKMIANDIIVQFLSEMKALGFDRDEIIELMEERI